MNDGASLAGIAAPAGRKRIAIVVPCLHVAGGSVKVATWMANRFVDLYDVVLVSCDPISRLAFETDPRVVVTSLDLDKKRVIKRVYDGCHPLVDLLDAFGADLVFAVGTYEALISLIPTKKKKIPLIFCDHGALVNQWNDVKMRAIRWLDARWSSKTVTLTEKSACDYQRLLGIPEERVCCIPNAVGRDFEGAGSCYRSDSKRVLWAGRLSEEKGVDLLLEIARRVLPSRPDWVWDVYGEVVSEKYRGLPEKIEKEGLSGQLVLKGRSEDMLSVYRSHSIGVLTSFREGLPLFLLEGKACGLPLVSFDVETGPRDILSDGEDGYLIRCFDVDEFSRKLGDLMDDARARERMSIKTLETVGRFSEDRVFARWCCLADSFLR